MVTKPVEIPRSQDSVHCKGILMADKLTANQFSQQRPRDPITRMNMSKTFCYDSKSFLFLVEQRHIGMNI